MVYVKSIGVVSMKQHPRKLYTIYRNKDDLLIVFEQPAGNCAEIMGISRTAFFSAISRNNHGKYTVIKTEYVEPC